MKNTLNSVNNISEDVETTVTAMEEIFAAIDELNTLLAKTSFTQTNQQTIMKRILSNSRSEEYHGINLER